MLQIHVFYGRILESKKTIVNAVIVSNGFPPSPSLLKAETQKAGLIVGADGGGNVLLKAQIQPDVVIGDLDSFVKPEHINFELIHKADQETNDLEKALLFALRKGCTSCIILGAYGKRMDHALKNLSVLKKFDSEFEQLMIKDERFTTWYVAEFIEAQLPTGQAVSLFPLSGKASGITTKGLRYPLTDESLENGKRDGTSNETVASKLSVEVKQGDLLVFIENGEVEIIERR